MTTKTRRIISTVIGVLPSAGLFMSGFMKLSGNADMVKNMTAGGFGPYITLFGAMEMVFLILFFIPKTKNLGFFFICSYLGGALAVELSHAMSPMAAVFLALYWISMFLWNKELFLPSANYNN